LFTFQGCPWGPTAIRKSRVEVVFPFLRISFLEISVHSRESVLTIEYAFTSALFLKGEGDFEMS
jgi:hypothetical protein